VATDSERKPYLTPQQVAAMLMVSPVTVRQWARSGKLAADTTPGGHRRFLRREVERFARSHGLTLRPGLDEILRVLIVDDDQQFQGYLGEVLAPYAPQVEVDVANDGFEAGRKAQSFRPDVMLLDIRMPGLDGITVCRQLKDDPYTRGTRVLGITGYYSPDYADRMVAAGADVCMAKPIEPTALIEAIGLPPR